MLNDSLKKNIEYHGVQYKYNISALLIITVYDAFIKFQGNILQHKSCHESDKINKWILSRKTQSKNTFKKYFYALIGRYLLNDILLWIPFKDPTC